MIFSLSQNATLVSLQSSRSAGRRCLKAQRTRIQELVGIAKRPGQQAHPEKAIAGSCSA